MIKTNTKICFQFLLLFTLLFQLNLFSQITTVNGYNYQDVNRNSSSFDLDCLGLPEDEQYEMEYNYTSFQLAKAMDLFFTSNNQSFVVGNFILQKRFYLNRTLGEENFKWILIRPNDDVVRPTIHITHGGKTGGSSPMRVLSLGVFDYVQRGYAVVYYQSGSTSGNSLEALADAGLDISCTDSELICDNWPPDCDIDCFQQAVYLKAQFAKAALEFSAANYEEFNLNKDLFFGLGFSGGGVGTLTVALADNSNFENELFAGMNDMSNLSLHPNETYALKAVTTLAGGIVDVTSENYSIGQLIDANDTDKRFLLFHGQDDPAVQPETNPLIWSTPEKELQGSMIQCAIDLKDSFDQFGITNKAIINCSACHDLFTFPCDYNDDCGANNNQMLPLPNNGCLDWISEFDELNINFALFELCNPLSQVSDKMFYVMNQIHDYSRISAHFLQQDIPETGPESPDDQLLNSIFSTEEISALNPIHFPYNNLSLQTNGHLVESSKCLAQTCSGLYFDRNGIGNTNQSGDFLNLPVFNSNIFNDDFTIEISIKPISYNGIATIFSSITSDFSSTGFEIFINSESYLVFKKNVNGQGTIVGSTFIEENECYDITLTREGNEFGLYVNGELQDIKKTYNITFPDLENYKIGTSKKPFANSGFNGIIKNVKIWTSAIPEFEFSQTNIDPATDNLLSEWAFSEKVGQTLTSTNGDYILTLGEENSSLFHDPYWMKNDEMCSCGNDSPVGIEYLSFENQFISIYPNPSSGEITIKNLANTSENLKISIFNLQGKLILETEMRGSGKQIFLREHGVYILQIKNRITINTSKIIIQ